MKPAGKVAGQPASAVFAGSYTQTDALGQSVVEGVTYSVVQKGNVLVAGFTYAPTRTRDGGGAVALDPVRPRASAGRFGLRTPEIKGWATCIKGGRKQDRPSCERSGC